MRVGAFLFALVVVACGTPAKHPSPTYRVPTLPQWAPQKNVEDPFDALEVDGEWVTEDEVVDSVNSPSQESTPLENLDTPLSDEQTDMGQALSEQESSRSTTRQEFNSGIPSPETGETSKD